VTHSGLFKVTTENPDFVERGHSIRLQAMFEHVNDGPIDPASLQLKIYQGSTQLGADITPTKDDTGSYYHDYNIPATSKVGPTVAEWTGTYAGNSILVRAVFYVRRTTL